MYRVLTGKQRSLVFPIMCNACVKIDYSDNIPKGADLVSGSADDIAYGIWGHKDSFTIEALVTPYDINGYGRHSVGSAIVTPPSTEKVMPAPTGDQLSSPNDYLSDLYMARADRFTHQMAIFHSTKVQLYLVNTTEHNENSPAEYKIRFMVDIGGTAITLDSPTVFTSVFGESLTTIAATQAVALDVNGKVKYDKQTYPIAAHTSANLTISGDRRGDYHEDQELFILDGFSVKSIGKVSSLSYSSPNTTVVLDAAYSPSLAGEYIFLPTLKHPAYISNATHIAATYNDVSREMQIYYNNKLVASTFHTVTTEFSFDEEDFFLGANGNNATVTNSAASNKQFMGELHEFAISGIASTNFYTFNLTPRYAHTLLYFRFEEVDE
jgi:hypothetical protein